MTSGSIRTYTQTHGSPWIISEKSKIRKLCVCLNDGCVKRKQTKSRCRSLSRSLSLSPPLCNPIQTKTNFELIIQSSKMGTNGFTPATMACYTSYVRHNVVQKWYPCNAFPFCAHHRCQNTHKALQQHRGTTSPDQINDGNHAILISNMYVCGIIGRCVCVLYRDSIQSQYTQRRTYCVNT